MADEGTVDVTGAAKEPWVSLQRTGILRDAVVFLDDGAVEVRTFASAFGC